MDIDNTTILKEQLNNAGLPADPHMLASAINLKLRDLYTSGLDELCYDLNIEQALLIDYLKQNQYDYIKEANQFR